METLYTVISIILTVFFIGLSLYQTLTKKTLKNDFKAVLDEAELQQDKINLLGKEIIETLIKNKTFDEAKTEIKNSYLCGKYNAALYEILNKLLDLKKKQ